jgi:tetratricopeptide (TPR) repeat protein
MSSLIGEKDRKILPRWRDFASTTRLGELVVEPDTDDPEIQPTSKSLDRNRDDWEKDPSLWNALDFIADAIVENRLELAEKAIEQVRKDVRLPSSGAKFLDAFEGTESTALVGTLGDSVEAESRRRIRRSRQRLVDYPWDPIEWVDLARSFTALGLLQKAGRCVSVALGLAPENRFVLRCAARFYVQIQDMDRAAAILGDAHRIEHDPWILASEIAVSSSMKRISRFAKRGMLLMNDDFAPHTLTELGAALGTLETETGNNRRAKKLLKQSLLGANENSIAQIEWLNHTRLGGGIDISRATPPGLDEAQAWRSYFEGDWTTATKSSTRWLRDQPFSGNAATLHSYIVADMLENFEPAVASLRAAIRCNPDSLMLRNNLAYSLINLGELTEAEKLLRELHLEQSSGTDRVLIATVGLLEFRKGNAEMGRNLYLQAIEQCKRLGLTDDAGRAATYLAIEEVRAKTGEAAEAIKRSHHLTRSNKRADTAHKLKQLEMAESGASPEIPTKA